MTDFNLTEFLHVILSLCHNSQRRRRRLGRMRKRGASNRTGVGVLKRRQVLPLPFRECGSGIMCHGSVRMQRRDTFGGIWRGMRHKTRRRGSSFFFSRFLHSHVICRLPANYLAIILEKISGRRAGGTARERLGRSPELATTKLATSNSQSAL